MTKGLDIDDDLRRRLDVLLADKNLRFEFHGIGGGPPIQGYGRINGWPWYFRARGAQWSFEVGDENVAPHIWWISEEWGVWPAAGYMTHQQSLECIIKAAKLYQISDRVSLSPDDPRFEPHLLAAFSDGVLGVDRAALFLNITKQEVADRATARGAGPAVVLGSHLWETVMTDNDKTPTPEEELEIMDEARRWIAEAKAARPPRGGSITEEVMRRFPERYRWPEDDQP